MVLKSSLLKLWFEKCQTRKSLAIRWTNMLGNTEVLGRDQGAGGPAKGRGAGGKVSGFQLHVELTEQCWALHPPPPLPAIHTALSAGGSPSSKPQPDGPALQTWLRTCHLQGSVGQYVIWNNFSLLFENVTKTEKMQVDRRGKMTPALEGKQCQHFHKHPSSAHACCLAKEIPLPLLSCELL